MSKPAPPRLGCDARTAPGRPPPAREKQRKSAASASGTRSRLPVSVVALSAATGVLVVAAAYTAGRLGYSSSPWANRAYWLGQALIVFPVAVRLLVLRPVGETGTVTLVVVLTVAEYLVKVCYNPAAFTFPDELQHWRSTVNLLHTGKLFTVNYVLPISPHYPGLEEVTSALASVTGLTVFTSGLIVAGVAHLLFICLLYQLFRHLSASHRIAGIAVLIYYGSPNTSFNSLFAYQTLAVAFLGLAVLAAWRVTAAETAGERAGWLAVAALAIAATVVTHHVTSFMLVVTLVLVTLASLLASGRRSAGWPAVLALMSVVVVACWVAFAAPGTVSYLKPVPEGMLQAWRALLTGGHSGAPSVSAGPLGNRVLAAAAALTLSALLPVGWWHVWRHYRHRPWVVAMAIGSLSWYAIILVRLVVADGAELEGRAATFVFVPAAFIAALAVCHLGAATLRWRASTVAAAALIAVLVLIFDGLVYGWPPSSERLPGPHQVAAFDRSVGPEETAACTWALAALGPGNPFAADFGIFALLGGYGDQNPAYGDAYLYTSPVYTRSDALRARAQSLQYILVDRRLSQSLPASGDYFPGDPKDGGYSHPLPLADLTKFNHSPGVARIYDSGNIVIYDLGGPEHAP